MTKKQKALHHILTLSTSAKMELVAKLMRRIEYTSPKECWQWLGAKDGHGYGQVQVTYDENLHATVGIHRIMYALIYGDPGEQEVTHSCDTPSCPNPRHLVLGSHAFNMGDMGAKHRSGPTKHPERFRGTFNGNAKLSVDDVKVIRKLVKYRTQQSIADQFCITQAHVSAIVLGKNWK